MTSLMVLAKGESQIAVQDAPELKSINISVFAESEDPL